MTWKLSSSRRFADFKSEKRWGERKEGREEMREWRGDDRGERDEIRGLG